MTHSSPPKSIDYGRDILLSFNERKIVPLSELEHAVKPEDSGKTHLLSQVLLNFKLNNRKKNTIVLGRSGTGKVRLIIKPNDVLNTSERKE